MAKLLIIDDEKSIRKTLREILEYEKFSVDEASDGAEGIALIQKNKYDIVLCDIKMPKMDGMEVLDKIMQISADTPVVMISGHGTIETAVEAVKKGVFSPPSDSSAHDYRGLQKLVADAQVGLQRLTPEEVNALEGKEVTFQFRDRKMPFVAEGFLLSFSLPNFHFHATTTYDILRLKGVPLGKRDYMGPPRLKS